MWEGNAMQKLNLAIYLVEQSPNGWEQYKRIVRETDYARKFWLEPFRNFSGPTSARKVRLAHNWDSWENPTLPRHIDGFIQANNLIHEACHQMQIDKVGMVSWLASYSQRSGRYRFEIEAYRTQIKHVMQCFQIADYSVLGQFIEGIADMLLKHYLLFGYRTKAEILSDLTQGAING